MAQSKTEVIAVTSGKGGVGKTTLTVNLGISMALQGKNVCLFDADTNLANINIMLRETPSYTLQNVLDGDRSIADIIIRTHGISLVPGASGVTDFNMLGHTAQARLIKALALLEQQYDVILVDTSAGIQQNVLDFIQGAHQSIILITPEPTSLTDAFSLLRLLRKQQYRKRINVVVNQAVSELGARQVFKRFSSAVAKYIGFHPAYLGYVMRDELVPSAISSQVPVRVYKPDAIASKNFDRLGESLMSLIRQQAEDKSLSDDWQKHFVETSSGELAESVSSPVPGIELTGISGITPIKETSPAVHRREKQYQQADKTRKIQVLDDHKRAIVDYIEDSDFNKQEIAFTLDRFLNSYYKRFKDYPSDLLEQINLLLQTNALPQAKINQLLSGLMLFYKDNRIGIDRDSSAELINQQINDYVDEYGEYPFDTSQALMQSIGMGQVSNETVMELDSVLNLLGKNNPPAELKSLSQVYVTDIEQDRSELAESIKEQVQDANIAEQKIVDAQALKDSIGFASKLAE